MIGHQHRATAERLTASRRSGVATWTPSRDWPDITVEDGYAIQELVVAGLQTIRNTHRGWKIGLTSAATRAAMGSREPIWGELLDVMQVPNRGVCDVRSTLQPRAEGEVAIVLGSALRGPGVASSDVQAATADVAAAIEIIDSRLHASPTLPDLIADHAFAAFFVVGEPISAAEARGAMILESNAPTRVEGTVTAGLASQFDLVAWLANRLADRGRQLEVGDIILTGSVTPTLPVRDRVRLATSLARSVASITCAGRQ